MPCTTSDFQLLRKLLAILTLKKGAISEARAELHRIDFGFLIAITFGALLAVVASARLIIYLLNEQHDPTYGFFSGLVLTSVIIPFKMLKRFTVKECCFPAPRCGVDGGADTEHEWRKEAGE